MPTRTLQLGLAGDLSALHRLDERKAGAHRPLGIVLVRLRVAEIDQHAVAHVLGDKAVEAADRLGDAAVIGADHLAQVLGIEPRRERRRADEVAEHHRQLPALGRGSRTAVGSRRDRPSAGSLRPDCRTAEQNFAPWPVLAAARRTSRSQWRPALVAEPALLADVRPAARAFHAAPGHSEAISLP